MDPSNVVHENQPKNGGQRPSDAKNDDIDGKSNDNDNKNRHIPIRTVYVCAPGANVSQYNIEILIDSWNFNSEKSPK